MLAISSSFVRRAAAVALLMLAIGAIAFVVAEPFGKLYGLAVYG